ncbi:sensor domain-containing diguanylate cyclase [Vibrio viridaestus]|uniref:sensor domain-containing diguanylate cyclase n=1 Tax=Vibrio viridaestus TaxID=2487322 RepID=UPI001407E152|nr:diguanylate cyclase [Vibrio viridaestus]
MESGEKVGESSRALFTLRRWLLSSYDKQALTFIIVWLGVWLLGYIVEYVHHASVWFPPAGLTFAALLVVGRKIIPPLVVCAVISTMWTGVLYQLDFTAYELIVPGLVFAVTHITPYFIAATILRRLANSSECELPKLALVFLITAVISSFITSFLVIWGLVITGLMAQSDIAMTWLPFWIGDMTGIIALGPVFMGILLKYYPSPQVDIGELKTISLPGNISQFVMKLALCCVIVTLIMAFSYYYPVNESHFAIFFMLIPLMWIAYTETPARIAISVALFSTYIVFLVNLFGLMQNVMVYQFAICTIAASTFFYISIPSLLAHNQDLQVKTQTDALTGVASRNYLMERTLLFIHGCESSHQPLAMIVFDIDHFKAINDRLGHSNGDKGLKKVAKIASSYLRENDLLARYGGDEFVIVLPNTDQGEAQEISERILRGIRLAQVFPEVLLSCSFGVAQMENGDDFARLFERADRALYLAKNSGRSQVRCI